MPCVVRFSAKSPGQTSSPCNLILSMLSTARRLTLPVPLARVGVALQPVPDHQHAHSTLCFFSCICSDMLTEITLALVFAHVIPVSIERV